MTEATGSDALKSSIGRIGLWSFQFGLMPTAAAWEALAEVESLGFGAVWLPEIPMRSDVFTQAALLLPGARKIVVASGIANIWMREPSMMANAGRTVAEAYPGRLVVGIGVSHQPIVEGMLGRPYRDPLGRMRAYLDGMDAAQYFGPEAEAPPRVLAALGPKMLRLAAERAAGAHPYFVPVEHTAYARETLGTGPLLAPEVAVVLERDPEAARKTAREYAAVYLGLDNYRRNLLRVGFGESDLAKGGSDKLIDAVVAWGSEEAIRARVREHLDAGADHVCVQVLGGGRQLPMAELRELAPALLA